MTSKQTILIVEDEQSIRSGLVDVFVYHSFEVEFSDDGADGLEKALTGRFDLILLDVMLPTLNGFEICKRIRELDKSQPIIMLTAKTADEDIIQGLSLGADDYVSKPFSVAQLVLRVQAVLRRSAKASESLSILKLDASCSIDTVNFEFICNNKKYPFTKREIEVIEYLSKNTNRPVSREELLTKVWGYHPDLDIETRTVDIHIAKIRKKIEIDPKSAKFLVTVRGAGYKLNLATSSID